MPSDELVMDARRRRKGLGGDYKWLQPTDQKKTHEKSTPAGIEI